MSKGLGLLESPDSTIRVKVSAAMLRQMFHPCDKNFIRDVCHARCCHSSSSPTGIMVTIHATEIAGIVRAGAAVVAGMLQPKDGEKKCPFKNDEHLCKLHGSETKPFGCAASPFTLNRSGTLIVRNRYRMLKCYKADGAVPAYIAHAASLVIIFGPAEAERIADHLCKGGGDMTAAMPKTSYHMLMDNDTAKRKLKNNNAKRKNQDI